MGRKHHINRLQVAFLVKGGQCISAKGGQLLLADGVETGEAVFGAVTQFNVQIEGFEELMFHQRRTERPVFTVAVLQGVE